MNTKPRFTTDFKIATCEWYMIYTIHGASTFEKSNAKRFYNRGFKLSVIKSYFSNQYSLGEVAAKHNISSKLVRGLD